MLRSRLIYRDAALTVHVVESVETWHSQTSTQCHVVGKIEPLAVVVCGPEGEHAVDINAQPIDRDCLTRMLASAHPANADNL